jgi:hypothetical protein
MADQEQPAGEGRMEGAEESERRRGEKENTDGVEAFLETAKEREQPRVHPLSKIISR